MAKSMIVLTFLHLTILTLLTGHSVAGRNTSTVVRCFSSNTPITIWSPGNFRRYPPNVARTWLFAAETFQCVNLTFTGFEVEPSSNCSKDFVRVYDGASASARVLTTRLCGTKHSGLTLRTTSNAVTVMFKSDGSVERRGFKAFIQQTKCENPKVSKKPVRTSTHGRSIVVPRCLAGSSLVAFKYPTRPPYRSNSNRHWAFISPPHTCIELNLKSFDIERSANCSKDSIGVFDGISQSSTRLLRMCGGSSAYIRATGEIPKVTSSKNSISLTFASDHSTVRQGFDAEIVVKSCLDKKSKPRKVVEPPHSIVTPPLCGQPVVKPLEIADQLAEARVVGGIVVKPHSWPWQVSIRRYQQHTCGGSILSRRHILTAAHCFTSISDDPGDFEVWVGKFQKNTDETTEQRLAVEAITIQPNYADVSPYDSDLAIVRLEDPGIEFGNFTQPICLPSMDYLTSIPITNTSCYVTGFGETLDSGGSLFLKQAKLPILSLEHCAQINQYLTLFLTPNMVCAGYPQGGHDSCLGDSGGPLACKFNDTWWLGGVVSYGIGCAQPNSPGVYTRVANFVRWLEETAFDLVIP